MTDVVPLMLLVGAIAGVISFGLVQSLVRMFPRGREQVQTRPMGSRPPRMRTATLQ
jgi:hypothetical protein